MQLPALLAAAITAGFTGISEFMWIFNYLTIRKNCNKPRANLLNRSYPKLPGNWKLRQYRHQVNY